MRRSCLRAAAALVGSGALGAHHAQRSQARCADCQPPLPPRVVDEIQGLAPAPRKKRDKWVESRSGVPFPHETSVLAPLPGGQSQTIDLPFLGGGVRCMPPWEPCSPEGPYSSTGEHDSHVYAYAIYANVPEDCGKLSFADSLLKMDGYKGPRSIRVVVTIPKAGIHWSRGYWIALIKRLKTWRHIVKDKKRYKKAKKGLLKFCECFADFGIVKAGAEFDLTWTEDGLLVSHHGKELGRVKNLDAIITIFDIYFGQNFNAVNEQAALAVSVQWRARCKSPDAQFPQRPLLCKPFNVKNQPKYDQCVLQSNQYSSSDGHGFDRAMSALMKEKKRRRAKRMGLDEDGKPLETKS